MKSRKAISLPATQAVIDVPVVQACPVSINWVLQSKVNMDLMSY
jgi:hypothetical protein